MRTHIAFVGALVTLGAGGASAQSYVGTWSPSPALCRVDQSMQTAPMVVRRNRYDQHETHCVFLNIRKTGDEIWRVRTRCTVEGDRQTHTFTMSVKDGVMTLREGRGARNLTRCG